MRERWREGREKKEGAEVSDCSQADSWSALLCSGLAWAGMVWPGLAVPGRMACSALRLRSLLDPIYQGRVDVVHWTTIDISCGEKFSGIQRLLC